ncbi:hypothetical protein FJZ31_29105 [Candidatus Poribacteria bacterium]|nr:hypothetical protein [Candidatus Poribacteria bacterium]
MEKREIYLKQKEKNLAFYERDKNEIIGKYKGQYVAIAHGKLLACTGTYQEALEKVKNSAPEALHFLIFPAEKGPFRGIIKVI